MKTLVVEDRYPEVAAEADSNVEVFQNPAKALAKLDNFNKGVFDIFQPQDPSAELNDLLDEYIERIKDADPEALIQVAHKYDSELDVQDAIWELEDAILYGDVAPYGAALAYEFLRRGGDVVFVSNLHRHSTSRSGEKSFEGWLLLLPFFEEGVLSEEEFKHFEGEGPAYWGGEGARKREIEIWKNALESIS